MDAKSKAVEKIKAWSPETQVAFSTFMRKIDEKLFKWESEQRSAVFKQWQKYSVWKKKEEEKLKITSQAIEVFKTSTRCQRSPLEKDVMRKFIQTCLTCIPFDKITSSDIDKLCNEIDWIPVQGRSILFLQGDFGNVWYMVARGRVALYLEPSKDKEMVIAREFGNLRGVPYSGTDQDLLRLGMNIFTVKEGNGFGEFAILNAKQKIRSCAAVAADSNNLCLILHADCYNVVMRKLHTRQRNITLANALLQELALFKQFTYQKIASIGYTLKNHNHSNKAVIVKAGDKLDKLFLVISGEIRVIYPQAELSAMHVGYRSKGVAMAEKMLPSLAMSQIGRGCIIGETEIQQGKDTFAMTYKVCSAECEVFEMPLTVYMDVITSTKKSNEKLSKKLQSQIEEKDNLHGGRVVRAYNVMKGMIMQAVDSQDAKETLNTVIPSIIASDSSARTALLLSSTISIPDHAFHALNGLGMGEIENQSQAFNRSKSPGGGSKYLAANLENSPRKDPEDYSHITSESIRFQGSVRSVSSMSSSPKTGGNQRNSPRPPETTDSSTAHNKSSSSPSPRKILFKDGM